MVATGQSSSRCRMLAPRGLGEGKGSLRRSFRVMEDDAERMPSPRPQAAYAVSHVDAVVPPRAPDRSLVHGEDHALPLAKGDDLDTRLHARPLLGQDELAPREVGVRLREQERHLQREYVVAVEVLVERIV